mmetsp:Transcript_26400/g.46563  ORF Transcript_26400/g.46563 Transcript_26400/m.46563 type:complete len:218 (+) Transcript_26400:57-710(+)
MAPDQVSEEIVAADLAEKIAPYWHAFVLRGLVLIGFGLFFVFYPAATWSAFSIAFGCLSLCDAGFNFGKACIVGCCTDMRNKCQLILMFLLSSLCGTCIGLIAICYPAATAEALLIFLALWLIFIGIAQFWFAVLVGYGDDQVGSACCIGFIGILYCVTGITFLLDLEGHVGFFILFVGLCLVIFGIQMVFFGVNLKRLYGSDYAPVGEAAPTSAEV